MTNTVLKELREAQRLSQEKLAEIVGVNRSTISMIEIGINKPSVDLAKRLGAALRCDWPIFFD